MAYAPLEEGHNMPQEANGALLKSNEPIAQVETEAGLLSPDLPVHNAYERLSSNGFRLLKILQGKERNDIYCYIQEFPISSAPEYVALSYMWGSQYGVHEIFINGLSLRVPKNLWRFLRQARSMGGDLSGWLWVDLLSINQRDILERGQQVQLMSAIFAKSERVLVWLGPAYQWSDIAMVALSRLSKRRREGTQSSRLWQGNVGHAVLGICERAYWRRLWIFQELRLAREIRLMCGEKLVEWHQVHAMMESADPGLQRPRHVDTVEAAMRSPAIKMARLKLQSVDTGLWSLVRLTSHLRCLDVRDKVYALLGVATGGCGDIEPDYSVPIPTLMNQLLHEIFRLWPPSTLEEAVMRSSEVEDALNAKRGTIFTIQGQRGAYIAPSEADMRACKLGPSRMSVNLWWTEFYRHDSVRDILLESWQSHWFASDHRPNDDGVAPEDTAAAKYLFSTCMLTLHRVHPSGVEDFMTPDSRCDAIKDNMIDGTQPSARQSPDLLCSHGWLRIMLVCFDHIEKRETGSMIKVLFGTGGYLACEENKLAMFLMAYAILHSNQQLLQGLLEVDICPNLNEVRIDINDFSRASHGPLVEYPDLAEEIGTICSFSKEKGLASIPLLSYAACLGRHSCVEFLMSMGQYDVNIADARGWTPVMYAAEFGQPTCVNLLLKSGGCDLNVCGEDGWTPMMCATRHQTDFVVKPLLDRGGFEINKTDLENRTQILRCVQQGRVEAVGRLLAVDGCNVDLADEQGWLPLTLAVYRAAMHEHRSFPINYETKKYRSIVRMLLNSGLADVNARVRSGMSALHFAVAGGSIVMVKVLLGVSECAVHFETDDGETALDIAIRSGKAKIVQLLASNRPVKA